MSIAQGNNGAGLRILVVDDNRDAANTLRDLVRLWGHECRAVYSGAEALTLSAESCFDVLLLDIGMPDPNGFAVAARVRERGEGGRPVLVAVTGFSDDLSRQRSWEAGFHHHLIKPVNPALLRVLLASILEVQTPGQSGGGELLPSVPEELLEAAP
jgi:CheY-like chemotaxis protein